MKTFYNLYETKLTIFYLFFGMNITYNKCLYLVTVYAISYKLSWLSNQWLSKKKALKWGVKR